MSKMFILAATLLCAAWIQAQDTSPQASSPSSAQTGAAAGQTTVEGCLQGSNGSFTLTDSSGTVYQLQGDNAKLSKHVGHTVQITGSTSESTATGTNGPSSTGGQTLNVNKVKHISTSCKGMSK
jgi:FlaG/FlaF family flagellin (archaellin)